MIGFNGTYLRAASLGNMRITAAAIGGQLVIGSKNWLLAATKQAIMAAFGSVEGTAVIKATNDYLNAIAATDPQRAQQLSAFINEDPLLVCSLVETSKTRWLVSSGGAWINTNYMIPASDGLYVRFTFMLSVVSADYKIGGSLDGMRIGPYSNTIRAAFDAWGSRASIISNIPFTVTQNSGLWECNGSVWDSSKSTSSTQETYIFRMNGENVSNNTMHCSEFIMLKDNIGRIMYPFIRNGEAGMLDILSGTFYPNVNTVGQFTIQLSL